MYDLTAHRDQLGAALRDIAFTSFVYWQELQKAGFAQEEAWEVMLVWNETFARALVQPSS
jgi:hypothetical protein